MPIAEHRPEPVETPLRQVVPRPLVDVNMAELLLVSEPVLTAVEIPIVVDDAADVRAIVVDDHERFTLGASRIIVAERL